MESYSAHPFRDLLLAYSVMFILVFPTTSQGFPGGSNGKVPTYNAGDLGLMPGSGSAPGEGNGNSLQYSCLEKSMNGGAW